MQQVWWRWCEQNSTRCDPPCFWWLIDWCSCCWAQNSSKDGIRRGRMMILMQLFFSTKLLKQASSCDNPDRGVLIVRDMREKRKSNSTTWLRRSAKNCMEKGRTPGAIRNNKNSNKTTPPNRKRQLLQNHNDNRQKTERQRARDREQASKQASTSYYYCAHILLRHKQHSHNTSHNDASTTQPRRTKRQKSLKDTAGLHHHHHHRRWKRRYNSSTLIHSFIHHIRTFHPTAPAYQFLDPGQRDE